MGKTDSYFVEEIALIAIDPIITTDTLNYFIVTLPNGHKMLSVYGGPSARALDCVMGLATEVWRSIQNGRETDPLNRETAEKLLSGYMTPSNLLDLLDRHFPEEKDNGFSDIAITVTGKHANHMARLLNQFIAMVFVDKPCPEAGENATTCDILESKEVIANEVIDIHICANEDQHV